jgi:hypothetical protein
MDPTTMTLDEIRDWAARRQGWTETTPAMCDDQSVPLDAQWHRPTRSGSPGSLTWCIHPIPPTLDAIAGLMPEGWWWTREGGSSPNPQGLLLKWAACQIGSDRWGIVTVPDTGNELLDRARLAMLATLAEDKHKEPRP